jgi:hypothetical protein
LQLLRLLQINNGVFVKVTKATSEMLLRVEPYITYGEVSLSTVRQLVYKRGYGKVNKQRVPLSSNAVIEQALGKFGILSIEDLIHEIVSAGPNFRAASKFVSNFLSGLDFWPPEVEKPRSPRNSSAELCYTLWHSWGSCGRADGGNPLKIAADSRKFDFAASSGPSSSATLAEATSSASSSHSSRVARRTCYTLLESIYAASNT